MLQPVILKIGGSLMEQPDGDCLRRLGSVIAACAAGRPLWIVPGGGPFADLVRRSYEKFNLNQETCHFMALAAMEQYAYLLQAFIPGSEVTALLDSEPPVPAEESWQPAQLPPADHSSPIVPAFSGKPQILLVSRYLSRIPDTVLPRSWEVTSDSIAAFLAKRLGSSLLVVLKSTDIAPALREPDIDPFFRRLLPLDSPVWFINGQYPERLACLLQKGTSQGLLLPAHSCSCQVFP
jgi:aspartokinase-like uncharacterized kinase